MDLLESLLTQPSGKQVGPELLEMLGRQASEMFRSQGIPLNKAIVQLAAQHPELGNEHVKRIVEFANTVTFQEMFQANQDKNIHFDISDPGVVLRDLKDGGSPAFDGKTLNGGMGDYKMPPSQAQAGMGDGANQELNQLFQGNSQQGPEAGGTKLASAIEIPDHSSHANPVEDVYDAQVRLQATRERVVGTHEQMDLMLKHAYEDLYQTLKLEVVDPTGAGLGGCIGALEKVADSEMVAEIIEPMIARLAGEGIRDLDRSLEKRAGQFVNYEHPIIQSWSGLIKAAEEKCRAYVALEELDRSLAMTNDFLAKSAGAVTTGIRKAVAPGHGRVSSALRQRFPKA